MGRGSLTPRGPVAISIALCWLLFGVKLWGVISPRSWIGGFFCCSWQNFFTSGLDALEIAVMEFILLRK
ncbi:hypothetical protein SLEP1_g58771 [Rubroshorea leprosula]|uniref:Uncharacterized protein n=1 Tax=Rubroshorea leprosula TaxID=152421 RepID=A0AAV5MQJ2_9ROSI|nr:hypothetical protein SLEP1_g58771 [Rubroshorea leprosula]